MNWTLSNKLQQNFNQNTKFFIHENAYENIVCEMVAILSGGGGGGGGGEWVNRISIPTLWKGDMDDIQQNFNTDANVPFHAANYVILMSKCIWILNLSQSYIKPSISSLGVQSVQCRQTYVVPVIREKIWEFPDLELVLLAWFFHKITADCNFLMSFDWLTSHLFAMGVLIGRLLNQNPIRT